MNAYDHKSIEEKWQERWDKAQVFATPTLVPGEQGTYIQNMFPYPSGSGLHVGHLLGYTGTDVTARIARMQGKKVLHPMGWDAFGLPAENYALKTGVHPADSTVTNVAEYKRQFRQAGISYDWAHELNTSQPDFYKWTQWLFQFLYKQGLAYRATGMVNWCPKDQTVLANEQVVQGACERCGTTVVQKELTQWYFKITHYAEELLKDLDSLDWPEKIKAMQRNWIGRSEGVEIAFQLAESEEVVQVFTTRPDTLFGATYLVLAPEHPLVSAITTEAQAVKVAAYQEATKQKNELERQFLDKEKTGVWTGAVAVHPLTQEEIPVWISDYVLTGYGTGAVMAVPAHDERDYAFAKTYDLPIKQVVAPRLIQDTEPAQYRPGEPVKEGESVIVFIKHPLEDKYLGLDWKESAWGAKTLLTGTIENLTPEETLRKEILEETGYTDLRSVTKLGVIDGLFYHLPKQTNKLVRGHVYVVELGSETKEAIEDHEEARHDVRWLTVAELPDFLTPATHQFALDWLANGLTPYTEPGALVESGKYSGLTSEEAGKAIADELEARKIGKRKVTYRLRDWLVSRQRYWGAPIPVAYDAAGKAHLIPEEELPVELPRDVTFSPTGESPLMQAEAWRNYKGELTREADTLDTFVCSSWYYLRFANPHYNEGPFDPTAVQHWLPATMYVGGSEHAVLHLLYARFITKALHDAGLITFSEPFLSLRNQGSILGPDHQKMSKSKGNVINPDEVIAQYGADTLRIYELFMGPFEQEKPWDTTSIIGVRRFLEKVWRLAERVQNSDPSEAEERIIHKTIKKVTEDTAAFQFNTAISTLMEAVNALQNEKSLATSTYQRLLTLLNPYAPHITEELWEMAGHEGFASLATWPAYEERYLTSATWICPVQINGKVKAQVEVPTGLEATELVALIQANEAVHAALAGRKVLKAIGVPGRLVSLVVSG